MNAAIAPNRRPAPALDFEAAWRASGFQSIAGVDEVGRGALAGPLVAAAVILPCDERLMETKLVGLNDSKVLSSIQRERYARALKELAVAIGVGVVDASEVDEFGLTAANRIAMERAVWALPVAADALLLDAFMIDSDLPQHGIIDGDALCLSIAAASVIAKVTRDRIMVDAHRCDDRYGFDRHKGYGAPTHLEALRRHGPCSLHRRCFGPVAALLR